MDVTDRKDKNEFVKFTDRVSAKAIKRVAQTNANSYALAKREGFPNLVD